MEDGKKSNKNKVILGTVVGLGALAYGIYSLFKNNNTNKTDTEKHNFFEKGEKIQNKFKLTDEEYDYVVSKIEKELVCPISLEIMSNPVNTACGHSFENEELISWIQKREFCPVCNQKINEREIFPNFSLKSLIEKEVRKLKNEFNRIHNTMNH
jgi:hypothetical protein